MLLCGSSVLSSMTAHVARCLILHSSALAQDVLKRSRTQHLQMYIPLCMLDCYTVAEGHDEMAGCVQRVGTQTAEISTEEENLSSVGHEDAVAVEVPLGVSSTAWR